MASTSEPMIVFNVASSSFSDTRPPVATLNTSPATPGVSAARNTPSTTLLTKVKSRVWPPSP